MRLNDRKAEQGSTLLVAMGITFVLGLGLASYLSLMRWQEASVARSQGWNAAMGLAEAGVEDALAQLNPSALIFGTNINRGANDWTLQPDGLYHAPRRTLPDGYYDVSISADTLPVICATGYVTIPTLSTTISRAVRVTTTTSSLFRGAMAAVQTVDFKGNNVETDGFDSNDPNYSTAGLYDSAKRKASGDVLSSQGIINVQNAEVMGTLYTAPTGDYTIGGGSVGDIPWVLSGTPGMEDGHYKNDLNVNYPDVLPPYQQGIPPAAKTIAGTNYTWVLGNNNYLYDGSAKFNSGDTILITGAARLYVTGDFIMGGGSSIIIAPGANIELYVGGANTGLTTVNNPGSCATFSYYGLPGNTTINLSGNNTFLGTFYAPEAAFKLSGSGTTTTDFQGSCVVNTIQMNGHFRFHYDENLNRKGPVKGYEIASWSEI